MSTSPIPHRAPVASLCAVVALMLVVGYTTFLSLAGCAGAFDPRPLDPEGPYQGDTLLARYDEVIIQTSETFDLITDLADRNPAAVAANPDLAEAVEKIRAEQDGVPNPSETLTRLFLARDAYEEAKNADTGAELDRNITRARTLLETARGLIPLFIQPDES